MEVYLVQHAESKSEAEDPTRPLTDGGREEVDAVACYVATLGIEVAQIFHSSKLRAKQTAEVFAQHLVVPKGIAEREGLGPLDDPVKAEHLVEQAKGPVMIVGHLPHLSRLASLLVLGEVEKEVVRFRMGAVVCRARSGESWSIDWTLITAFAQQEVSPEAEKREGDGNQSL